MTTSNKMKVKQISGEASTLYDKFSNLHDRLQEIVTVEEDWIAGRIIPGARLAEKQNIQIK